MSRIKNNMKKIIILSIISLYSCNNMNVTPPIAKKVKRD